MGHRGQDLPLEIGERVGQGLGLRRRAGGQGDTQLTGAHARHDRERLGVGQVPCDPVDQTVALAAEVLELRRQRHQAHSHHAADGYSTSVTMNISTWLPMRNSIWLFRTCCSMRSASTYVPLVDPRSRRMAWSPRISSDACCRDASGSSMLMSAPDAADGRPRLQHRVDVAGGGALDDREREPLVPGQLDDGLLQAAAGDRPRRRLVGLPRRGRRRAVSAPAPPRWEPGQSSPPSPPGGASWRRAAGSRSRSSPPHFAQRVLARGRSPSFSSSNLYLAWQLGQTMIMPFLSPPSAPAETP